MTKMPQFNIFGINPCESLSRHTPAQIEKLISRMTDWGMNTIIIHAQYGYIEHKELITELCLKNNIKRIYYIHSLMDFNKKWPKEFFALDDSGNTRTSKLENETRLCVSNNQAIKLFRENSKAFFNSSIFPKNTAFLFTDADGYLYCQCEKCQKLGPVEQWNKLFKIIVEEMLKSDNGFEAYYLSYVWRYKLPSDMSVFNDVNGVFFDTHQRYRWKALDEHHETTVLSQIEAQKDERVNDSCLNQYLYDRLKDWRKKYAGKLIVFENLMLQGSLSCPQPYTANLLRDLELYKKIDIDGIIYEAFEPGIQSFTDQLGVLSNYITTGKTEYRKNELEENCTNFLKENPESFNFKNQFNVLSYLTTDLFNGIDLLKTNFPTDNLLHKYSIFLKEFLINRNWQNYSKVVKFVIDNKERFDFLMISFNLARAVPKNSWPDDLPGEISKFLTEDKLWDFMKTSNNPIGYTTGVVRKLLEIVK
jgi:hypothetical protein